MEGTLSAAVENAVSYQAQRIADEGGESYGDAYHRLWAEHAQAAARVSDAAYAAAAAEAGHGDAAEAVWFAAASAYVAAATTQVKEQEA